MPQGARETECPECGYTYGTHALDCEHHENAAERAWERSQSDCMRGGEYAASVERELAEARKLK